jgi:pimeloyl-ACP methyl ester carboxylesterase
MPPDTHYAKSGEVRITYQVFGQGAFDLVYVPGFISNIDHYWDDPALVHFLERLAAFSRVIVFDKRGTGLSDRTGSLPTLEERMDDVRAVMDAVGSERAAVFGISEGGAMSMLFAATYPERTQALVLYGTYAHFFSDVLPPEQFEAFLRRVEQS